MKNIDQLIEQIHNEHRNLLEMEAGRKRSTSPRWHYAAAAAFVLAAIAAVLIARTSTSQKSDVLVAQNEQSHSSYSMSKEGIRVYCEDNCNADEVMQRFLTVIESLD